MNPAIIWAFVGLLMQSPASALNPTSFWDLWQKANAMVVAVAPSASPTPTAVLRYVPRRQATPSPAPTDGTWLDATPTPVAVATEAPAADQATSAPVAYAAETPAPVWTWPSDAPTDAPSANPTTVAAAPVPNASPFTPDTSGAAWPNAGWVPYPGSLLTVPVSSPTYTSDSAAVVSAMWGGRPGDIGNIEVDTGSPPGSGDYSQPLYMGRASDPVYTIRCTMYGGGCAPSGAQVHIPRNAYPAGGTDHHLSVRDLATGKDVMLWLAPIPSGAGGTLSVGWGAMIDSSSNGLNAIGGTASGISALWAVRAIDLQNASINHAIIVQVNGESASGYVSPATGWDNGFFHADPWPKIGAHLWLDVAPPYNCPQSTSAIVSSAMLTALNKYGAYVAENGAIPHPMQAIYESDAQYTSQGMASAWAPVVSGMGGTVRGQNNLSIDNCGIDFSRHMHVLTPPAALW